MFSLPHQRGDLGCVAGRQPGARERLAGRGIEDDSDESCRGLEINAETFQVGFQVDEAVLRAAVSLLNPQLVGAGFQALDLELAPVIGLRPTKVLVPSLKGAQVSPDHRFAGTRICPLRRGRVQTEARRTRPRWCSGSPRNAPRIAHQSATLRCHDLPFARRQVFEGEVPLGIRRRDVPLGLPRGADLDTGQIGGIESGDDAGDRAPGFQHDVHAVHGLSVDLDRLGGTVLREARSACGEEVSPGLHACELELSVAARDRLCWRADVATVGGGYIRRGFRLGFDGRQRQRGAVCRPDGTSYGPAGAYLKGEFVVAGFEDQLRRFVLVQRVLDGDQRGAGADPDLRPAAAVGGAVPGRVEGALRLHSNPRVGDRLAQLRRDDDRELILRLQVQVDLPLRSRLQFDPIDLGCRRSLCGFERPGSRADVLETEPAVAVGSLEEVPRVNASHQSLFVGLQPYGGAGNGSSSGIHDPAGQQGAGLQLDQDRFFRTRSRSTQHKGRVAVRADSEDDEFVRKPGESEGAIGVRCGGAIFVSVHRAVVPGAYRGAGHRLTFRVGDQTLDLRAGHQGEDAQVDAALAARHFGPRVPGPHVLGVRQEHFVLAFADRRELNSPRSSVAVGSVASRRSRRKPSRCPPANAA